MQVNHARVDAGSLIIASIYNRHVKKGQSL
jgi:hypothetical protein